MRNHNLPGGEIFEKESKDIKETEKVETALDKETRQETSRNVKQFFQNFSQKHREEPVKALNPEEQFRREVQELERNTAPVPGTDVDWKEKDLTQEEIEQLEENDPGYVNDKVLDYDNEQEREENTYTETGLHTGAIRWGDYATKEGVEYTTLQPGQILSRWGSEKGSFLAEEGTDYDKLQLPVVREKNEQNLYEVLKPFPVEVSKVAVQPWNQKDGKKAGRNEAENVSDSRKDDSPEENDQNSGEAPSGTGFVENAEGTRQYRTPISVEQLVKNGYLRKL